MGGARLETLDELDLLRQHGLLALELRLLLTLVQGALLLIEFVVSGIVVELARLDLHDLGDDAVHELAVVRGQHEHAVIVLQELLQPDQAFEIEMVARLVEQHRVRLHQEDAGQCHAHLPAARELAHVAVHHLLAEAEARENLARPALQRVAPQLLEARLHLAVAFDQLFHVVAASGIAHRRLEFLQLERHTAHRACAIHHFRNSAAATHLAHVLAEVPDGDATIDRHLPLVRLLLPGDHAEQCRLAGAVRPHKPDLFPPVQSGRCLHEQELVAVLLADVVDANHESLTTREPN